MPWFIPIDDQGPRFKTLIINGGLPCLEIENFIMHYNERRK
jgi:hypothetical protein